jgi:hypothetical protein
MISASPEWTEDCEERFALDLRRVETRRLGLHGYPEAPHGSAPWSVTAGAGRIDLEPEGRFGMHSAFSGMCGEASRDGEDWYRTWRTTPMTVAFTGTSALNPWMLTETYPRNGYNACLRKATIEYAQ